MTQPTPMSIKMVCRLAVIGGLSILSGCSSMGGIFGTVGQNYKAPANVFPDMFRAPPTAQAAPAASKPEVSDKTKNSQKMVELSRFWREFNDPVLTTVIDAAQKASPSVAQAKARLETAQSTLTAVRATELPNLEATASASRTAFTFSGPITRRNQADVGLRSNWEIDLFGSVARQTQSAVARLESTNLAWHDARVTVAANTASAYFSFRQCEAQRQLLESDVKSRDRSLTLTKAAFNAGLKSDAMVSLEEASAAESRRALLQTSANCEIQIKAMVALTGIPEQTLRTTLDNNSQLKGQLPEPPGFNIKDIPAEVLMQRPDVASAERELAAASADIGAQQANLYPRLSLNGNVNPTRIRIDGGEPSSVRTWSIGPSMTLPLFDRGKTKANIEAAKAQYVSAEAVFRDKARQAVREVEEAMIRADSTATQKAQLDVAVDGYGKSLSYEEQKKQVGLASELDVEQSRRLLLNARQIGLNTQLERINAWINLYRAVGGDWRTNKTTLAKE